MTAPMPHPLIEAFGRPTWRELQAPAEAAQLAIHPVELSGGADAPVVVVPGFCGSERSLATMVTWLSDAGYDPRVASMELNVRGSGWAADRVVEALEACNEPAILIGHSRGGQQARIVAARHPELVRSLITLGAPLNSHVPHHFALRAAVESLRLAARAGLYHPGDMPGDHEYARELAQPFTADVPWTSIWSRNDGLVAWQACQDEAATDVEVTCSHRGLVESVSSYQALASVLAASRVPSSSGVR